MAKMKTEIRWAVVYEGGLYVGQWQRRKDAVHNHCVDLGKTWRYCFRKGDRVVKIKITYTVPKFTKP